MEISASTAFAMVQTEIAKWNSAELEQSDTVRQDGSIIHNIACDNKVVVCLILDSERNLKQVVYPVLRLH